MTSVNSTPTYSWQKEVEARKQATPSPLVKSKQVSPNSRPFDRVQHILKTPMSDTPAKKPQPTVQFTPQPKNSLDRWTTPQENSAKSLRSRMSIAKTPSTFVLPQRQPLSAQQTPTQPQKVTKKKPEAELKKPIDEHPALKLLVEEQASKRGFYYAFRIMVSTCLLLLLMSCQDAYAYRLSIRYVRLLVGDKEIAKTTVGYGINAFRLLLVLNILGDVYEWKLKIVYMRWKLKSVPMTQHQRKVLRVDESVGKTVEEKDKIRVSPEKRQPEEVKFESTEAHNFHYSPPFHVAPKQRERPKTDFVVNYSHTTLEDFVELNKLREYQDQLRKSPQLKYPLLQNQQQQLRVYQPSISDTYDFTRIQKKKPETGAASNEPVQERKHFEETLTRFKIVEPLKGIKAIRTWIRNTILSPLIQNLNLVDDFMTSNNMSHLTTRNLNSKDTSITTSQNSSWNQLRELANQNETLKLRMELEAYFLVPRTLMQRTYIVDRLIQLEKDVDLAPFSWDSGGLNWNADYPSDAELLFHVFCAYMDTKMAKLGIYLVNQPFTTQFVLYQKEAPRKSNTLKLAVVKRHPLHLNLTSDFIWDVVEGRNNLFYAILILVANQIQNSAGYLDALYLGGQIGLVQEVKPCLQ